MEAEPDMGQMAQDQKPSYRFLPLESSSEDSELGGKKGLQSENIAP